MKFIVDGQTLIRVDRDTIATKAVNYPEVEFDFIKYKWQGITQRVAIFQVATTVYNAVTDQALSGNTAYAMNLDKDPNTGTWKTHVPMEILANTTRPLKFIVTVWGGSVSDRRMTTNAVLCEVDDSFYDPGQVPGTPTPGLWDQIEDDISDINTRIDGVDSSITNINTSINSLNGATHAHEAQINALESKLNRALTYHDIEFKTEKKWVHGEDIYARVYTAIIQYTENSAPVPYIIDASWDYKWTLIDHEINYSNILSKRRDQICNPGVGYSEYGNNEPTVFVTDSNHASHSSSQIASLCILPSCIFDSIPAGYAVPYTLTVYFTKNSFAIALEASKFEVISGSAISFQDSGYSIEWAIQARDTVVIQSRNRFQFKALIQSFDIQARSYGCNFNCKIGLYNATTGVYTWTPVYLNDSTDDWEGIYVDGADSYDVDQELYLRYTVTNETDSTRNFRIGVGYFYNVPDEVVNNI